MEELSIPPFRAHRLLRGPHRQTLAAAYLPSRRTFDTAVTHRVDLADGDQIVLHDDCPTDWQANDQTTLLMHGLAGCYQSGYMRRIAAKLTAHRVRVFRMDHRGCGAGSGLARLPYHAGAVSDVESAIESIAQFAPDTSLSLVGFSLSGNILLNLLGRRGQNLPNIVNSAVAVCPPVDLHAACASMEAFPNRLYGGHFVRLLMRQVRDKQRRREDAPRVSFRGKIRRLRDFDDQYTAPLAGFDGVDDYYTRASANQFLPSNTTPTLILASRDDPMIPIASIEGNTFPSTTKLVVADRGGHLGFLAQSNGEADRHWMDWRVVDWIVG